MRCKTIRCSRTVRDFSFAIKFSFHLTTRLVVDTSNPPIRAHMNTTFNSAHMHMVHAGAFAAIPWTARRDNDNKRWSLPITLRNASSSELSYLDACRRAIGVPSFFSLAFARRQQQTCLAWLQHDYAIMKGAHCAISIHLCSNFAVVWSKSGD